MSTLHDAATVVLGWLELIMGDDPDYVELRAVADNLRDALAREEGACPVCGGDCAGANPPVYDCPMKTIEGAPALEDMREDRE